MTMKPKLVRGGGTDAKDTHDSTTEKTKGKKKTNNSNSGKRVTVVENDYSTHFTPEEKAIYDANHAPIGKRLVASLSEAWLPLLAVAIIVISVVFMLIMRFSNTLLIVLAVLLASLLMGTIVYVSYEEQRKAHELADKAEAIYETAMNVKRRSSDGTATSKK